MKQFVALAVALFSAFTLIAAEPAKLRTTDVSFRNEVQRAIEKGNDFIKSSQNSNGWWSTPEHPSVTALALSAMMGDPNQRLKNAAEVKKGYAFVLSCAKPDGGIYVTDLANYNTSISMMALLAAHDPKYDSVLRKARSFVAGMQVDTGEKGKSDSPWDGGIGYSHEPLLAPTEAMLRTYRSEKSGWAAYEQRFLALMAERGIESHLTPGSLDGACLLCSEATPDHCHRRLVVDYLNRRWGGSLIVRHL